MKTQETPKAAVRAETNELVQAFLDKGGQVTVDRPLQSGNGYSGKDWARIQKGEKVATGEEIAAERERRALLAIKAKNVDLAADLLSYRYDKVIKFDIEAGRLDENKPKPSVEHVKLHDNYGALLAPTPADVPQGAYVIAIMSALPNVAPRFYKLYAPNADKAQVAYWLDAKDAKQEAVFAAQATTAKSVTYVVVNSEGEVR